MYKYEDVRVIHFEVTERCQAGCPMCGRFEPSGDINKNLVEATMSLATFNKIFPVEFISQLHNFYMCGNYGDPIIAPDTLAMFERLRDCNFKMRLGMYTNGGGRSASWWTDLAALFEPATKSRVVFAIDGLEDTNHIYRRNVSWKKVMSSAKSFIKAGGKAEWHFLVFKHNEHQIEEARKLSIDMGFHKFILKKSSRFWSPSGNSRDFELREHALQVPDNKSYVNDKINFLSLVKEIYGSYDSYLDQAEVKCLVKDEKSLYVSARGEVYPCCWLGSEPYNHARVKKEDSSQMRIIKDFDKIDANKRSIKEILDDNIFSEIEKSWGLSSVKEGKLLTCAKTCSTSNFFKSQFHSDYVS